MYRWENWSFLWSEMRANSSPLISFRVLALRKEMVDTWGEERLFWAWKDLTEHYIHVLHTNRPLAASAFLIASSSAFSLALAASTSLSRAAMGLRYSAQKNFKDKQSIYCDYHTFQWLLVRMYMYMIVQV